MDAPYPCFYLDHKVQKVDWSLITRDPRLPDKVAVECTVNCKSGDGSELGQKILYADYVICTMPLGYLKKHHENTFLPSLDENKVRQCLENYPLLGNILGAKTQGRAKSA